MFKIESSRKVNPLISYKAYRLVIPKSVLDSHAVRLQGTDAQQARNWSKKLIKSGKNWIRSYFSVSLYLFRVGCDVSPLGEVKVTFMNNVFNVSGVPSHLHPNLYISSGIV